MRFGLYLIPTAFAVAVLGSGAFYTARAVESAPEPSTTAPAVHDQNEPLFKYLTDHQGEGLLKGLVAWWPGHGNTNDLVGENVGKISGGVHYWPAKIGQGFLFNGTNGAVLFKDTDALKLTKSFTISAWLAVWSVNTTSGNEILFRGDDRPGLDPYALSAEPNGDGRVRLEFLMDSGDQEGPNPEFVVLRAPIPIRKLVHLAVTMEDATGRLRMYLNGKVAAGAVVGLRPFRDLEADHSPGVALGNTERPDVFDEPFHGILNELMIYSRALAPDEISTLYRAGEAVGATPAVAQSERILFCRTKDTQSDIFRINPDGRGLVRLTRATAPNSFPSWSPDGNEIVFSSQRDGAWQIYRMNSDGSDVTRLTESKVDDFQPQYSTEGGRIVFVGTWANRPEVFTMDAGGSNVRQLTSDYAGDSQPAWSPDGSRIAFVSARDGTQQIFSMNPDGSYPLQLSGGTVENLQPAWSPDGLKIAFSRGLGNNHEIGVMAADGAGAKMLTHDGFDNRRPAWSRDGTQIVFQSNRSGQFHLYSIHADGSHLTQLTNAPAADTLPCWGG